MRDEHSGGLASKEDATERHRYRMQYVPDRTDPDSIAGDTLWAVEYHHYAPYEHWEVRYTNNVLNARYFARPAVDVMVLREGIYPRGNLRIYETMADGSTEVVEPEDE